MPDLIRHPESSEKHWIPAPRLRRDKFTPAKAGAGMTTFLEIGGLWTNSSCKRFSLTLVLTLSLICKVLQNISRQVFDRRPF
jgi:hypothetical protein